MPWPTKTTSASSATDGASTDAMSDRSLPMVNARCPFDPRAVIVVRSRETVASTMGTG